MRRILQPTNRPQLFNDANMLQNTYTSKCDCRPTHMCKDIHMNRYGLLGKYKKQRIELRMNVYGKK